MLGLYATNECVPLDVNAMTNQDAEHVCGLLHRALTGFLPLWELEVVSDRLTHILTLNHLTSLNAIAKVHPWKWRRMAKLGRTSYDELRGLVKPYGIPLLAWEEIKIV